MLPGGPRLPQQFHPGPAEFFDGRRQIAYREADHRASADVFLAWVLIAEDLDMAAIGKLENPEARFGVNQPQTKRVLIKVRQFRGTAGARATPAEACNLHAGSIATRYLGGVRR